MPQFDLRLRGAPRRTRVLFFPELLEAHALVAEVGVQPDMIVNLSANYTRDTPRRDDPEKNEREWEESLEPFVPFSLLLQRWLIEGFFEEPRSLRAR
jgi:hypothetical protein